MNERAKYSAVISVIGRDQVGIIAKVTAILAEVNVNVSDISQTILQDVFAMIMLVDLSGLTVDFETLSQRLRTLGTSMHLEIQIQHKDIFNAMQRI